MLRDIVVANRSYRGFDENRRISREELLEFVDLTRYTASSVNLQPLKYYIAYEPEKVRLICSMTKWARALSELNLPFEGTYPTGFIVICQDTDIAPNTARFMKDVGIVAQTILLAATEKGLGGCMIGNFSPEEVKDKLGLAENIAPQLIVAIGKPIEKIVITEVQDGKTDYYRDENNVHYVPKRKLEDILL